MWSKSLSNCFCVDLLSYGNQDSQPDSTDIFDLSKFSQNIQDVISKTSPAQAAGQCRWDPTHLEMYTICSYKLLQATLGSLFHRRPGDFIEMSPSCFCLGINLLQGHGSCLIWRGNVTKEAKHSRKTVKHQISHLYVRSPISPSDSAAGNIQGKVS